MLRNFGYEILCTIERRQFFNCCSIFLRNIFFLKKNPYLKARAIDNMYWFICEFRISYVLGKKSQTCKVMPIVAKKKRVKVIKQKQFLVSFECRGVKIKEMNINWGNSIVGSFFFKNLSCNKLTKSVMNGVRVTEG